VLRVVGRSDATKDEVNTFIFVVYIVYYVNATVLKLKNFCL
jgi:hypothetical protein